MRHNARGVAPVMLVIAGAVGAVSILGVVVIGYAKYKSIKQEEFNQKEALQREVSEKIATLETRLQKLGADQGSSSERLAVNTESDDILKEIASLKTQNAKLAIDARKKPETVIVEKFVPAPSSGVPIASDSQSSLPDIIERVKHGVVSVNTRKGNGSGFLISDTIVVTNAHVVDGIFSAGLHIDGGATSTGYIAGLDEQNDIAIIVVPRVSVSPLSFGDSSESALKQGDSVYAFGFPFGLAGDPSFASGLLSRRLTQDGMAYLEISNGLHLGNSGGPLVNTRGDVVGMFKGIYGMGTADGTMLGETIKFAIPGNTVKTVSHRLIVQMQPLSVVKKSEIDAYEEFMSRVEYLRIELSNLMSYRKEIVEQKDIVALKQLSAYANTVAGEALDLKKNVPSISQKNIIANLVEMREKQAFLLKDIFDNEQLIIKGIWANNDVTQIEIKRNQMNQQIDEIDKQYIEQEKILNTAMRGFSTF